MEQAEEAEEFVAAFAIRESYARLSRALVDERASESTHAVLNEAALQRFLELDALLATVVTGERSEVQAAAADLEAFRRALQRYALAAAAAAVLGVLALAFFAYRALMQPLRSLDAGSRELASGNIGHRIPVAGPVEYRELAQRLNHMAERLEAQRNALRDSNERLEETVEERTRQLADKAQRLQQIDESRRLFFAKVGHELRTPLTVLLGEAEVALQTPDADASSYRDALEHIGANGEHLRRRIADIMAVARSEDGQLAIEPADVDLAEIAREALDAIRGYARSNEIRVGLRASAPEVRASADADRVRQALLALLDNAIKFAPLDSEVKLLLQHTEDGAEFRVEDRGRGVPDDELASLAEPFVQGGNGPARVGTGLGLAVAQWVAEQHGGRLAVRNRDGGGLSVSLYIPRFPDGEALGSS